MLLMFPSLQLMGKLKQTETFFILYSRLVSFYSLPLNLAISAGETLL